MAQRIYFVGDSQGGWTSPDFWPDGRSLDMVVFEEDKPVRNGDLNLVSQNGFIRLRNAVTQLMTSGWTVLGALHGSPTAPAVSNAISVGDSWFNGQANLVHVANPDGSNPTPGASVFVLPAPPSSGTRLDLVYLELWVQEVAGVGSTDNGGTNSVDRNLYKYGGIANQTYPNGIYWNDGTLPVPTEPVRYFQLRWALRVQTNVSGARATGDLTGVLAQGGAATPSALPFTPLERVPDGQGNLLNCLYQAGDGATPSQGAALQAVNARALATPVALVVRRAGAASIPDSDLTDLRVQARLQAGLIVNQTNVYPTIQNDFDLEHLNPVNFAYAGKAIASFAVPTNSSTPPGAYDLSQSAYAVQFQASAGQLGPEDSFNPFIVRRVSLNLAKVGAGADVVVELRLDAGGVPSTTVLASGTIPREWLTTAARDVSCFVDGGQFSQGTPYWLVVRKGGTASDHAVLTAAANFVTGVLCRGSTDELSWPANASPFPFGYGIFNGVSGFIVHSCEFVQGGQGRDIYLFEYYPSGTPSHIGEFYLPAPGSGVAGRRTYVTVYPNPTSGLVSEIG
jgi:hypothetical protein